MTKIILSLFTIFLAIICVAQDSIIIGSNDTLFSKILREDRRYSISLPVSYNNPKYTPAKYPVLFILDGEINFEFTTGIVKYLSRGVYAHIPEMIVVGIHNTDRTRDMTPTQSFLESPDIPNQQLFTNSGGNKNFSQFIIKELIPAIDSQYRTNGFNILSGHSFGGLAVTNMLLQNPDAFQAFIIHDPSCWWDNGYI
ncbi:MAG: alpha/beta hydrolase, partial [Niabella sp.]